MGRATSLPEGGVREASVREALAIIEQDGVEKLSLREVARRLGVSHQAPYKYFSTREHLLAEVIGRCFDEFGAQLEAAASGEADLEPALMAMGDRYLEFAAQRPSAYRLMFSWRRTRKWPPRRAGRSAPCMGRSFACICTTAATAPKPWLIRTPCTCGRPCMVWRPSCSTTPSGSWASIRQ